MRILLGMSGGLDSTYSACLLKKIGHEVVGCALRMHAKTPIDDAKLAAEQAGIPLTVLDCEDAFEREVVQPFVCDYAAARTPNPCVRCNRSVKIEALCRYARENGFDRVATGHYAAVLRDAESGRWYIRRAENPKKDQSYALWGLKQEQLAMLMFPLADADKSEIRARAAEMELRAAEAKESMENCFIPDEHYAEFLARRGVTFLAGDFIDQAGNPVGRHCGIGHYTIGQRKGLGLSLGRPVFVTAIDPIANTVTVGDAEDLMTESAQIANLSFQLREPSAGTFRAMIKIRYAAPPVWGSITVQSDLSGASIRFDAPVRAVTPGQSAVCYEEDGGILMGGVFV